MEGGDCSGMRVRLLLWWKMVAHAVAWKCEGGGPNVDGLEGGTAAADIQAKISREGMGIGVVISTESG